MAIAARRFTTKANRHIAFSEMGFGAAPIGNMVSPITDETAVSTVRAALSLGVNYVDVAPLYGHGLSESRVGAALQGFGDVTLSTKVGRLLEPCAPGEQDSGIYKDVPPVRVRYDYSYDGVMRAYAASRDRLRRPVDILFVHDIDVPTHGSEAGSLARLRELIDQGGWRALDELRSAGDVTAIGAGGNDVFSAMRLLEVADPDLFLLAGRYTLLDQQALPELLPACEARGVGVVIGGPFNSGILATGPVEGAWFDYAPASAAVLTRVAAIETICSRHGVRLAAAALRFPLLHPATMSVIPGGRNAAEVERNASLLAEVIPAELWDDLKGAGYIHSCAPC